MTLVEFLEYVKAGGAPLAIVFAVLFWMERDERKDAQKELRLVAEKSAAAMIEMKSLVAVLTTIFKNGAP